MALSTGRLPGGLVASLFLHGLLLTPLLWGGGHVQKQRMPNAQGASASQHDVKFLESMMVVFMEESPAIREPSPEEITPSARFLLPQPPIRSLARPQISAPTVTSIEVVDERAASEADGDQMGHSMLFGRYMGQISARVERAWARPRSVPTDGSFACRVQITQDEHGNVREVTLEKCTEDPQWQVSLVRAISAASPFPAPPDPAVFSNLLRMEFDSDPYVAGASDQGFEPAARAESRPGIQSSSDSRFPPTPASAKRRTRPDGSIDLTIVGSPAQISSQP